MGHSPEKKFPLNGEDYELYEEIGEGISATVYKALCVPLNVIVAIKVLDLEKCNNDLDGIRREVQTMNLIDHANVLRAYCSFTAGSKLWVVMPYMAGGSCLHIMKSSHPEGFEEPIIATLLREVLKALVYLHAHGHIHRDVKAGNILIDSNGAVKLADFGVSACMFDTGDRQRSRNTFVGTPCWMAPEVMQQVHGYDFKADIWSFGITALELAHGHAPFSKYPPMKVLLMTLQNAPPGLDYERDKKFSKSFKEMVGACLVKDPKKRPTSEKLLKHRFFDYACSNEYLARRILRGLCPLGERFRILKSKEDDLVVQNKANYGDKEHISQREYIRGISGWNFNTEDLKSQAALIQEDEGILSIEEIDVNHKQKYGFDDASLEPDKLSPTASSQSSVALAQEEEMNNHQNARTSFSISPLESLGDSFDIREGDTITNIPKGKDSTRLESRRPLPLQVSPRGVDKETRKNDNEILERSFSMPTHVIFGESDKSISGPLTSKNSISPPKIAENNNGYRESVQPKTQPMRNYSGTMLYCQTSNLAVEDTSESTVKCKGRFKVTSDLSPKAPPTIMATPLLMSLQSICKQSEVQKNDVAKLIRSVQAEINDGGTSDLSQVSPTSAKDRVLEVQLANLEQSFQNIVAELHGLKESNQEHSYRNMVAELHELKESNLQLVKQVGAFEKQLNALVKKENEKEKEGSVKKK